jgi:hypothetical protein
MSDVVTEDSLLIIMVTTVTKLIMVMKVNVVCAIVQAVSLTAVARVQGLISPCGICGGQSGSGADFCPSYLVFPCQYHFSVALNPQMSRGG